VEERSSTRSLDYATSMVLELVGTEPLSITGTQFEGQSRITRINDLRVDMQPQGIYLVGSHQDHPGVIAGIATLLARHDINIASVELGRNTPRGRAVMLMQVDEPVSNDLLAEIQKQAGLETLRQVRL